ncbi:metal-dependent hydrolase [Lachnoclostridium sp. An14]|uniref:M48 family metallopeptidase n=1 Tax=Lachnoclostridium sp. An14 TaxID=1965562 RepID=UPI000B3908BE|nr:SprT family zinc-dependent metalloprotease [Lachnoclostridium sp. An14]OUQ15671.1 metal-dependent hydrolase [Lachnoclostridium sp. An14]
MIKEMLLRVPLEEGALSISVEVIYSSRRTMGLEVTADGRVKARVPNRTADAVVEKFVKERAGWIAEKYLLQKARQEKQKLARGTRDYEQNPALEARYRELARAVIGQRVSYFAAKMGVTYGRISIRDQKTRWGSCSGRGNLNFNWKLVLMPPEVLDYVVVHELAHRKQMNHSPLFWAEVGRVLPDYESRRRWLKEHGKEV